MRYSYEYKRKCVELYREGKWPETPDGIKDPEHFHGMIRMWSRMEEAYSLKGHSESSSGTDPTNGLSEGA